MFSEALSSFNTACYRFTPPLKRFATIEADASNIRSRATSCWFLGLAMSGSCSSSPPATDVTGALVSFQPNSNRAGSTNPF